MPEDLSWSHFCHSKLLHKLFIIILRDIIVLENFLLSFSQSWSRITMCNLHWCYTFCTGVTLFALVLHLNCTALSQSELSNFFMYIIKGITISYNRTWQQWSKSELTNTNEIQIPYDKHHKVSLLIKSHQNTHNSVKNMKKDKISNNPSKYEVLILLLNNTYIQSWTKVGVSEFRSMICDIFSSNWKTHNLSWEV